MRRVLIIPIILLFVHACASSRYEGRPQGRYMVASWYGGKFHGRPTASGEIYDMYDYTAAHKTLPFGTKLRITNPQNGSSVVVKINDRGPFVKGRDIDLSYGAARKIDIVREGTARVIADYLGRDSSYIRTVKYIYETGPYTIQVASFRDIKNAYRLKSALEYSYSDVYIMKIWVKGKRFYRVRIGKFLGRKDAGKIAMRLSEEGYTVMITRYDEVL